MAGGIFMDYAVNTYDLYRDIQQRTGGEIYIGVLGPVRTGKSTFIKRFMDEMVLPYMEDEHARMRAQDELPQSAGGKTITTTEPKFIPSEAAKVRLNDDIEVSVRLIDCVGYMIDGATGHMEEDTERMVKTPWSEEEIPFTQKSGVCKVKCAINGLPLHFIFDTGATDVSISSVEATFMAKNDFLSSSDIIGKQNYQTADGNITEGTVINLKDVKLGSLHMNNIKASVVRNQAAPLLLGQSVLSKLGKIEIDNTKKVLRITHKQKIN